MKRFSEYKEEKIYEGLLSDIASVIKGKFTYFIDKAKKIFLNVVSPENIDGYNHDGVRVAIQEEMPNLKEQGPGNLQVGSDPTPAVMKRNVKALIDAVASAKGDINEGAVEGFGEINGAGKFIWKTRIDGTSLRNPVQDVTSAFVKKVVLSNIMKVSHTKGRSLPVLLFGAPGVGKTSMVNSVIDAYNSQVDSSKRKGLIVIDCANLGLESLSLVMPTIDKTTDAIASAAGIPLDDKERAALKKENITDMTKEWLPCYRPTGDPELDAKADAIANGHVSKRGVSTDGGIILLDELLRVQDPGVFGQLMNLILARQLGERVVGSKWTFVCVSNRPNDDKAVAAALKNAPSAFFNRFAGVYNVEPSLNDWLTWARGGNAADSFDFKNIGESKERDWKVDPRFCDLIEKNPKLTSNIETNEISSGEVVGATPRSWETLSNYLWDAADANNVKDWVLFPGNELKMILFGIIGKEFGQVVMDEIDTWRSAIGAGSNKKAAQNSMSNEERAVRDLITSMESIVKADEIKAAGQQLGKAIKAVGEQATNAIMSSKIAEWGTNTTGQRKFIVKVITTVYPELKGRFANYL